MTDKIRCHLSIPRQKEFHDVRDLVELTLQRLNVGLILPQGQELGALARNPIQQAQEQIQEADFIIADVTSNNPNVLYEVGFAHGLKKSVLLLVRENEKELSPLTQGYLVLFYETKDMHRIELSVTNWIRRFREGVEGEK